MNDLYLQLGSLTLMILSMMQERPITYTLFILNGVLFIVLFIVLFPKLVNFRRTWIHKRAIQGELYKQYVDGDLRNNELRRQVIQDELYKQYINEEHRKQAIDNGLSEKNIKRKKSIEDELHKQNSILSLFLREILEQEKNISNMEGTKLTRRSFKDTDLEYLLQMASSNELANLCKVLSIEGATYKDIAMEIRSVGSHTIATFFRNMDNSYPYVPYMEVVDDVLKQVGGSADKEGSYFEKECLIIEKYTSQVMDKMSDEEKQKFIDNLKQEAENNGESFAGIMGAGGSIVLANASGFGVYLLASSAVGSITGLLGITLPFAFYTSMSSTIAMVTGPLGWAVLAMWGISKIGSPNKKKTLPSVIMVAAVRARLNSENEQQVRREKKNRTTLQEEIRKNKSRSYRIEMDIKDLEKQLSDMNI